VRASRNAADKEAELQFLVVTRRRSDAFPLAAWTPQLLEEEAEYIRTLYLDGSVRAIWRRNDEPGAILIFEANTQDQVEQIMANLPLAKRGMLEVAMTTELTPYSGFGPASNKEQN
jgi:muconolactone delta-isomerase